MDTSGQDTEDTLQVATTDALVAQPVPERIGRYLVLEQIGRGGGGVVWRAYDPKLRREVALKSVHPSAVSREARARTIREARAMAMLSHPNVVAIHDVELGSGVVLVMEYVEGTTLHEWLAQQARPWQDSVAAFVQAGRGLHAAHVAGMLHRDFKPLNVLLTRDGRAKVTDFGIASIHEPWTKRPSGIELKDDDEAALEELEDPQTVVGSPVYMAPEQHAGEPLTAAADQFAFCVSLWQALTGTVPFDRDGKSLQYLHDLKLAGPPPWPKNATRTPPHIVRALRRGLQPHPGDRWTSMADLLDQLTRTPLRRRLRRLALVAVVLVPIVGVTGWRAVARALDDARCAKQAEDVDQVWNATVVAAVEAEFVATDLSYSEETFDRVRPLLDEYASEWSDTRSKVCLARGVNGVLDDDLADRARACLSEDLAALDSLVALLRRPDATILQRAVTSVRSLQTPQACMDEDQLALRPTFDDPARREQIQTQYERLAHGSALLWTGQYDGALEVARTAIADADEVDSPWLLVEARLTEGMALDELGRYPQAQDTLEQAFFLADVIGDDLAALEAANQLTYTVGYRRADVAGGERWHWLADMKRTKLGDKTPGSVLARLYNNTGVLHHLRGDNAASLAAFEQALEIRTRVLGRDHPDVAGSLNNIGRAQHALGQHDEALHSHRRALALRLDALGPHHPQVATSHKNIGLVHESLGEYEDALAAYRRALASWREVLGPEHPNVALALAKIGETLRHLDRADEAVDFLARAVRLREDALGSDHIDVAKALHELGLTQMARGEPREAASVLERAVDIGVRAGQFDALVVAMRLDLAEALRLSGDRSRAAEVLAHVQGLDATARIPERDTSAASDP